MYNNVVHKIDENNSVINRRWAWVEVDINAIRHNVKQAKNFIGRNCKLLAIVKANAYGHGAVKVAKTVLNSGAVYLGVATIDEALELRNAQINAPILLLSQPPAASIPYLIDYDIMPSIYTPDFAIQYAEAADAKAKLAPFHLAVNTGMNRIGVKYTDVVEFLRQINFHRALDIQGTFTHFATADSPHTMDFYKQLDNFKYVLAGMKNAGFKTGIVHCANSSATLRYPETHFDMVRYGIAIYGYHPCPETRKIVRLQPAMSVYAKVIDDRILGIGEGVGYEMNYRSRGGVKICTIPIGYADGLKRSLSSKIDVIYKGRRFSQVGNICMDQCMFEIDMSSGTNQTKYNAQIGDKVTLVGQEEDSIITLEDLAKIAGTNTYEMACDFSRRMPIIYV